MSFGSKVRKRSKERTLEVSSTHLIQHFHAFLMAGGLIARDEIVVDYALPKSIPITIKKVTIKNGEEGA